MSEKPYETSAVIYSDPETGRNFVALTQVDKRLLNQIGGWDNVPPHPDGNYKTMKALCEKAKLSKKE